MKLRPLTREELEAERMASKERQEGRRERGDDWMRGRAPIRRPRLSREGR